MNEIVAPPDARPPVPAGDIALIDVLDRLLQGGVVIHGDITLAAAEIDLVRVDLRLLISAIDTLASP